MGSADPDAKAEGAARGVTREPGPSPVNSCMCSPSKFRRRKASAQMTPGPQSARKGAALSSVSIAAELP